MCIKENYPDICSLINDAVTLHVEQFWSSVGDGATLSCPILKKRSTNVKKKRHLLNDLIGWEHKRKIRPGPSWLPVTLGLQFWPCSWSPNPLNKGGRSHPVKHWLVLGL